MRLNFTLDQWEKLSSTILSLFSVFAVVVAGSFALIEYYGYKTDAKQARSLKLVSEYHGEQALKYRNKLDEAWEVGYPVLIKILKENTDTNKAYERYVNALIVNEELFTEVRYVMDFFERVATCVNANICDKVIIDNFFSEEGRALFRIYYPYVCSLRNKWKDNSRWSNVEVYFNPGSVGKICI
jgi:hypothetical protein